MTVKNSLYYNYGNFKKEITNIKNINIIIMPYCPFIIGNRGNRVKELFSFGFLLFFLFLYKF